MVNKKYLHPSSMHKFHFKILEKKKTNKLTLLGRQIINFLQSETPSPPPDIKWSPTYCPIIA